MRKRPSIASVYRVSVSCQCIASVYSVRANIRDFKSVSFTPHPSVFGGLEAASSASSGVNVARDVARDVARNVARNVARDVVRNVVRDVVRNVARGVARDVARNVARGVGRMRQYEHLTGAGSPPLFYISHNLSVEMGDFTDKLLTLNNLSVRTCLFTDKPVIFGVNPCQDYARLSVSR